MLGFIFNRTCTHWSHTHLRHKHTHTHTPVKNSRSAIGSPRETPVKFGTGAYLWFIYYYPAASELPSWTVRTEGWTSTVRIRTTNGIFSTANDQYQSKSNAVEYATTFEFRRRSRQVVHSTGWFRCPVYKAENVRCAVWREREKRERTKEPAEKREKHLLFRRRVFLAFCQRFRRDFGRPLHLFSLADTENYDAVSY